MKIFTCFRQAYDVYGFKVDGPGSADNFAPVTSFMNFTLSFVTFACFLSSINSSSISPKTPNKFIAVAKKVSEPKAWKSYFGPSKPKGKHTPPPFLGACLAQFEKIFVRYQEVIGQRAELLEAYQQLAEENDGRVDHTCWEDGDNVDGRKSCLICNLQRLSATLLKIETAALQIFHRDLNLIKFFYEKEFMMASAKIRRHDSVSPLILASANAMIMKAGDRLMFADHLFRRMINHQQ